MSPALPFLLLGLAVCAVWVPAPTVAGRWPVPLWLLLMVAATATAMAAGNVAPIGVAALAGLGLAAWLTANPRLPRAWRCGLGVVSGVLALALALHRLPGFYNPQLIANVRFAPDALPYTQYANFDKGAVGLILLALLCRRAGTRDEWTALLRRVWPIASVTVVTVLALGVGLHVVRPDVKWPPYTPIFLATNLFFTCVAEEAFFRGLLQDRLAHLWPGQRAWQGAVVALSALLFGLAHLGGGAKYAVLATLCGVAYAYAYAASKRIEAPILVHFAFNAVHFIGFTYPALSAG